MLRLGAVRLVRDSQVLAPFRLADVWDGSILDKFVRRCAADPKFEALLASRMLCGEVVRLLLAMCR